MSAYDDYSHALEDNNIDDNYEVPKDSVSRAQDNNNDLIDLRIPVSTAELDDREAALITLEKNLLEKKQTATR